MSIIEALWPGMQLLVIMEHHFQQQSSFREFKKCECRHLWMPWTQSQLWPQRVSGLAVLRVLSGRRSRHEQQIKDHSQEGIWGLVKGHVLSVIRQRPITHTRQMFKCLKLTNRREDKGRQGAEEGGREGGLKHSSSSGLTTVSQREGGFQESASSAPSNPPHPDDRHFYICLKETLGLKMSSFRHPLQGESRLIYTSWNYAMEVNISKDYLE